MHKKLRNGIAFQIKFVQLNLIRYSSVLMVVSPSSRVELASANLLSRYLHANTESLAAQNLPQIQGIHG